MLFVLPCCLRFVRWAVQNGALPQHHLSKHAYRVLDWVVAVAFRVVGGRYFACGYRFFRGVLAWLVVGFVVVVVLVGGYDMGLDEYFYSDNWCFIEWPEKTPNLIPIDHASISIKVMADGKRELTLKN